jgi:hypothetical protein
MNYFAKIALFGTYSPGCREGVFPETQLPVYRDLGNSEAPRASKEGLGAFGSPALFLLLLL